MTNTKSSSKYNPTLLIILDGWGVRKETAHNAIKSAKTPTITKLTSTYPSTTLRASGEWVGLPKGVMGNSEVGHLNLGAGRIVMQDVVRITRSIEDESFFKNHVLHEVFAYAEEHQGRVHLLGLVSDSSVHSSLEHLIGLIAFASRIGFDRLAIHAFLDGRDSPPKSAIPFVQRVAQALRRSYSGKIATLCGRYYAMDRDKRWDRLEKAYRTLVLGEGRRAESAEDGIHQAYQSGETDEFVSPTVIESETQPAVKIQDGDGVIFFNFRADRARQLTTALTQPNFSGFKLPQPKIFFCSMTEYDPALKVPALFKNERLKNTLSEVWSKNHCKQFHIAETEKYAHVTYFFGGGVETPMPGEERLLIPSLKVPTYDQAPAMAAPEITKETLSMISKQKFDCIVLNFANADMVGHTGNFEATKKAVKTVEQCLKRLVDAVLKQKGLTVITADHGNAEILMDAENRQPHTAHTTNPVPLVLIASDLKNKKLRSNGILADVAPTILQLQGLPVPKEMTGKSLLAKGKTAHKRE